MKRSILIIEPSKIIYKGVASIIGDTTDLHVLQQVQSIENLDSKIAILKPDIVIVNPTLFTTSRYDTCNPIVNIRPDLPAIALIYQYVEADIIKQYDEVIDIRDSVAKISRTITTAQIPLKNEENLDSSELTDREKDVLVLIAKGQMSKEIADTLNISIHTVISHRKNITKKTGIKSIAGLVAYALLNNLINSSEIE